MVSPVDVAVNVTVPNPMAVIKPVVGFTVAEPLPELIEKVIAPPLLTVAVVVTDAVKLPSTSIVLADRMVSV